MSTPKAPAFQLYARDFLTGTTFFTAEQVGAYIRLLCHQWESGSIPNNETIIAQVTGCQNNGLASVMKKFEVGDDGNLRNARLEKVRSDQLRFREKQSQNAKDGWEKRKNETSEIAKPSAKKGAKRKPRPMPPPMPDGCSPSPNIIPPIVPQGDGGGETEQQDWDEDKEVCRIIWEGHPATARSRSSQAKVRQEWQNVPKKERLGYDDILASLVLWRASIDWVKEDGRFVPGCHRWIKERKWTVVPVPAPKKEDSLGRTLRSDEVSI